MKFLALIALVVSCYQRPILRSGVFIKLQLKIVIHIFSCHLNLQFCYAFNFSSIFYFISLIIFTEISLEKIYEALNFKKYVHFEQK